MSSFRRVGVDGTPLKRPASLSFHGTAGGSTSSYASAGKRAHSQSTHATATEDSLKRGLNMTSQTSLTPTCKHKCSCTGECVVFPPLLLEVYWWSYTPIHTITAATVFHVIHKGTNYTSTSTKQNVNSVGRRLHDVNAGGTTQTTISFGSDVNALSSTVLVYPTPFAHYENVYSVSGAIETTDAANGQPTCICNGSSLGGATFTLPSNSPKYSEIFDGPGVAPNPRGVDMAARIGTVGDSEFFRTAFPGQLAFHSCTHPNRFIDCVPEIALVGAAYLTETSTLHKNAALPAEASPGSFHKSTSKTTSHVVIDSFDPTAGQSTSPTRWPATPAHLPSDVSANTIAQTNVPLVSPSSGAAKTSDASASSSFGNLVESIASGTAESKDNNRDLPTQTFTNPAITIVSVILGNDLTRGTGSFQDSAPALLTSSSVFGSSAPTEQAATPGRIVPTAQSNPAPSIVVGSAVISVAASASPSILAGRSTNIPIFGLESSTIVLGQTAIISNSPVAFISSAKGTYAVIGGSTTSLVAQAYSTPSGEHPVLQVAGETATADSFGQYVIVGQTIGPGSSIVISGSLGKTAITVKLQTNSEGQTAAVINGKSSIVAAVPATSQLVVGHLTIKPNPAGQYVVSGSTLTPGATVTLHDGNGDLSTVALRTDDAGHTEAIINGQTAPLGLESSVNGVPLVVSGHTMTLLPGSDTTVLGTSGALPTTIALTTDSQGHTEAVINGHTSLLAHVTALASQPGEPIIVNNQTILPNSQGRYVLDGRTLSLDGEITLSDGPSPTTIALTTDMAGQTEVVVNGKTSLLSTTTVSGGTPGSTGSTGIGNYIMSGGPATAPQNRASRGTWSGGWVLGLGLGGLLGVLTLVL